MRFFLENMKNDYVLDYSYREGKEKVIWYSLNFFN